MLQSCFAFFQKPLFALMVAAQLSANPLPVQTHISGPYTATEARRYKIEIQNALNFIARFPPPSFDSTVFQWRSSPHLIKNKQVTIILTESSSAQFFNLFNQAGGIPPDADALTLTAQMPELSQSILVFLLRDRLAQESSLPAALIVSLAHEIYGNVQTALEEPSGQVRSMRVIDQIRQEIRAFKASVEFLENLTKQEEFINLDINLQRELRKALEREHQALRNWQAQLP